MSYFNDPDFKSYIFDYEKSEFLFCETEYLRWRPFFKMTGFSSIKITFRSSFATAFMAVAEQRCLVDVVPVFHESFTSSEWIPGTGPCNGTWSC